jgi:hypothetical protein
MAADRPAAPPPDTMKVHGSTAKLTHPLVAEASAQAAMSFPFEGSLRTSFLVPLAAGSSRPWRSIRTRHSLTELRLIVAVDRTTWSATGWRSHSIRIASHAQRGCLPRIPGTATSPQRPPGVGNSVGRCDRSPKPRETLRQIAPHPAMHRLTRNTHPPPAPRPSRPPAPNQGNRQGVSLARRSG